MHAHSHSILRLSLLSLTTFLLIDGTLDFDMCGTTRTNSDSVDMVSLTFDPGGTIGRLRLMGHHTRRLSSSPPLPLGPTRSIHTAGAIRCKCGTNLRGTSA